MTTAMQPSLHTERLLLSPFEAGDIPALHVICADPAAMAFIGPVHRTPDNTYELIARFRGQWALQGRGVYALRHGDELVGWTGVFRPPSFPCDELGFLLKPSAQGSGLAAEACRAVRDEWLRSRQGGEALVSFIASANTASVRLARQLGASNAGSWLVGSSIAHVYRHTDDVTLGWVLDDAAAIAAAAAPVLTPVQQAEAVARRAVGKIRRTLQR